MENKNIIIALLVVCGVLVCGLLYSQFGKEIVNGSAEEVVQKAIERINENVLRGVASASLIGAIEDVGDLYKFTVKIDTDEFLAHLTKDGKLFFPNSFDLSQGEEEIKKSSCDTIPKSNEPMLEAFVVSYCPFGLQMQRILAEIVKEIPELQDNISIRYLGQVEDGQVLAMHGEEEATENLKQICLREQQKDLFYPYLSCFLKTGESQSCLKEVGVNEGGLSICMFTEATMGVAEAEKDFEVANGYGAGGSPSLFLNGEKVSEFDFGGRTAEAVKNLICCGFEEKPEFCSIILSEEQAATNFSETYSGTGSAGTCD